MQNVTSRIMLCNKGRLALANLAQHSSAPRVAGLFLFLYPFIHLSDDKVEQSSLSIRKQRAGQGLNPGLPDQGFEAFSARPQRPPPLPNYITLILSYPISIRLLQTFISMRAKETSRIISRFKRECGEAMERRRMLV